jgi:hypothetical protein
VRSIGRRRGQGVVKQACHSTAPFEGLRVLSPSAVSSGPNGKVEGLMALSRIEGLGSTLLEPQAVFERARVGLW